MQKKNMMKIKKKAEEAAAAKKKAATLDGYKTLTSSLMLAEPAAYKMDANA